APLSGRSHAKAHFGNPLRTPRLHRRLLSYILVLRNCTINPLPFERRGTGVRVLDDKGRIFGKLSIIDLLIIVVLVSLAGWFGYAMLRRNLRQDVAQRQQETEIVVVVSGIRPTTA